MHVRQQIRDRVASILTGLPVTGSNVFASKVYPLGNDQLPGICIYTTDQRSGISSKNKGSLMMEHEMDLNVSVYVKSVSGYDDTVDEILEQVEKALQADTQLSQLVKFMTPESFSISMSDQGDKPVAIANQSFNVMYRSAVNQPDIAQ